MKKRKLFSILVVVPLLLTLFSACSSQNEDASPSTNTDPEKTSKETSSKPLDEENDDSTESMEDETTDTNSDSKKDTNQDTDGSDSSKEDDQESEETTASQEQPSDDTEHASEPDHSTIDFHLDDYLNTSYRLDGTHYKTESFGKVEGTDRTDYRVNILPDTQDFGQEINAIFTNGTPYEDKRTEAMMKMAETIIKELPATNKEVHIDSVNWVSYDGKTEVMLIQDYEQKTIN
ncbi:MSCRAMM family adhesin SdrC [Rossellomorea marisflavi]|uniref:MSCRAMM family adhesin SdrC n=1 Tax=Rossellomorea marisflavi TaxID=189381 RepID=UPI0027A97A17|nr:MSCRAMM family adhesin SdrC [Rossellomorea marisflavi]UTE73741.1 MSCRAMM family adhesin SdrC [Rossellomorea marisflavi]